MIRVVFDTNVIISGQLWTGTPRQAISLAERGVIKLLMSEAMLDELRDVLNRPKFAARLHKIGKTAENVVHEHLQITEIVEPLPISPIIVADPDDDMIIACAIGGKAESIVTGDDHLLALGNYHAIEILDVNRFLQSFSADPSP